MYKKQQLYISRWAQINITINFGTQPGTIKVEGAGHNLTTLNRFAPVIRESANGLSVNPGKTIALVGGNIILDGGKLIAESGRVELASVNSGTVSLNPITSGWKLGYEGINNFQDISLSRQALVDASGSGGSSIVANQATKAAILRL